MTPGRSRGSRTSSSTRSRPSTPTAAATAGSSRRRPTATRSRRCGTCSASRPASTRCPRSSRRGFPRASYFRGGGGSVGGGWGSGRCGLRGGRKDEAFLLINKEKDIKSNYYFLSKSGNLKEAARNLYSMLRKIKKNKYNSIAVKKIPNIGLGKTINDRLKRASKF